MQRLIYVSDCQIEKANTETEVARIVENSKVKNAGLDITGALLFNGEHFAQVLEGSPEAIYMLMDDIFNDPRHGNVIVADKSPITQRHFHDWQMAYQGPSQFVSRHVARLMHATSQSEKRRAAEWITDLAHEFSAPLKLPKYTKVVTARPSR